MSELEELRKKRLNQLQQMQQGQNQQAYDQELKKQEIEQQINQIIKQIMTPEARQRLSNIRAARPEFARQVEVLLIQLSQAGKLPQKIDDNVLKKILEKLKTQQRETQIKRI